jgi:hypothetical protein
MITTNGTYPWSFDAQIFRSDKLNHGGDIFLWLSDSICSCPIINKSTVLYVLVNVKYVLRASHSRMNILFSFMTSIT